MASGSLPHDPAGEKPTAAPLTTAEPEQEKEQEDEKEPSATNKSIALAIKRLHQCQTLCSFEFHTLEYARWGQRTVGNDPSPEDLEDFVGLAHRWDDVLQGRILEGAGAVLHHGFRDEAQAEMEKFENLKEGDEESEEDKERFNAGDKWREVLREVEKCSAIQVEIQELLEEILRGVVVRKFP
jgi:hypothetical protein